MSKSAKVYRQRVVVDTRRAGVPFDMMRYDNCVPATETDAGKLDRLARDSASASDEDRVVEFRRFSANDAPPTEARWRSFGCYVVSWRKEE